MKLASIISVTLIAVVTTAIAQADVFVRGDISLSASEQYGDYDLVAYVPQAVRAIGSISLPDTCQVTAQQTYRRGDQKVMTWSLACERHLLATDNIALPFGLDAAVVTFSDGSGTIQNIVSGDNPLRLKLSAPLSSDRSISAIGGDYLGQGIAHIAFGWDHLAFVLCLCLLTRRLRSLLLLITAFTIGHSVSMALSFLGVVSLAIPPIEVIIALSIVWMAREALLSMNQSMPNQLPLRHLIVVVAFGLIHGLGFASALEELGVLATERVAALGFFNLGVEIGQVAFVLVITALLAIAKTLSVNQPLARTALYIVGGIGCFWSLERIASFSAI